MAEHLADDLVRWLREGARAALPALGEELKRRAVALTPPDPERDPDPEVRLADDFEVRVLGDFVEVVNRDPYAVKQHEAIGYRHPNGGQAKFLEQPAHEMAREVGEAMAASVRVRERSGRLRVRGG